MNSIFTINTSLDAVTWENLVSAFKNNLMNNYTVEECLAEFLGDYINVAEILEQEQSYKDQAGLEVKKESREVFFDRKIGPVWDYIYSLQRQINTLKNDLQDEKVARKMYGPALSPTTYPTNVPPNGIPDLDWWKIQHSNGTGNVPLGGNDSAKFERPQTFFSGQHSIATMNDTQYVPSLTTVTVSGAGSNIPYDPNEGFGV